MIDKRSNELSASLLEDILDELKGATVPIVEGSRKQFTGAPQPALASNVNRKSFGIYNRVGNNVMYIRFNADAGSEWHAFPLYSGQSYTGNDYQGLINVIGTLNEFFQVWEL